MRQLDKSFSDIFGYNLGDYGISLDEIISKYEQVTGETKLHFMSLKSLLNCIDVVQNFIDIETLELHSAFNEVYPGYRVFIYDNLALVSFSSLLEMYCKHNINQNRYILNAELNQTEQTILNSALSRLKIDKLSIYQPPNTTLFSKKQKDNVSEITIDHKGIIFLPSDEHTGDKLSKIIITKQDHNEVIIECHLATLDHNNCGVTRTGIRHIYTLQNGIVTYKTELISPLLWMSEINCPMDLRKNPYNKLIWEYLSDEPLYQGTSLFVDSNRYCYGLVREEWSIITLDQLQWNHFSIPPQILAEYQLYTNLTNHQ